ncbi:MAG: diguanylate cyclase [Burkholderiales bacterium]|nr:diguanylate cyclase [Burkholderiales bacterium]
MPPDFPAQLLRWVEEGAIAKAIDAARRELPRFAGEERGRVLLALSTACWSSGDNLDALRAAVSAGDAFRSCRSMPGVCDAMVRIATCLRSAGDHASAITTLERAEEVARDLDDPKRLADVLRNVGVCCSLVGRHQQALSSLTETCALLEPGGAPYDRHVARLSLNNARNRRAMSLPETSDERGTELHALLGDWQALVVQTGAAGLATLEVMAMGNHAITLRQCGRHDEALVELQALLERYRAFGMRPNEGLCFCEIGRCYEAQQHFGAARESYLRSIEILKDGGTLPDLQEATEGLSRAEEAAGNHKAALEALKEVRAIDRRKSDEAAASTMAQRELRIELARLTSTWARQATLDPLTGLGNRRALDLWMSESLPRVEQGEPITLLLLDLDHFKQVNDRFGHAVGDEVLRRVAALIQQNCRSADLAVRYGGEEFVLALFGVAHEAATDVAHRLRASVEAEPWCGVADGLKVSVSIGVAAAVEAPDGQSLLTLADRRLYAAKLSGRNQVVTAG